MVGHCLRNDHSSDDFDSLLVEWTPLIRKVIRQLGFNQKSHDHEGMESDDAFQAGSLGLWFATMGYDSKKSTFISHAYNCVRWEILDEMRRTGWSRGRVSVPVNYKDFGDLQDGIDVEAHAIAEDFLEKIDGAVDQMDTKRRMVFAGVMSKGSSLTQLADMLDVSDSRVEQLKKDIRKTLKNVIH